MVLAEAAVNLVPIASLQISLLVLLVVLTFIFLVAPVCLVLKNVLLVLQISVLSAKVATILVQMEAVSLNVNFPAEHVKTADQPYANLVT